MDLQPGGRPVPDTPEFVLVRKLGAGAFGEVWRAHGPGGTHVALKFIRLDPQVFIAEMRSLEVMKGIRHPNLVSLFGVWYYDGHLILAMELCDRTLHDRLEEALSQNLGGIPLPELLAYMNDAASGLDALNAKVQHRDVKPANLLLLNSSVKVADFGLAKALAQTVATNSGAGTIAYLAPECFKGQLTRQSDQYSLAVTYFHLRTGRLLFAGDQAQMMYGHLELEPDLSQLPVREREALGRALAKDPSKRWASCKEFMSALNMRQPDSSYYCGRGIALLQIQDSSEAIKNFDEALQLDPNNASAYLHRGIAWTGRDNDRAILDFNQAIRLDPTNGRSYYHRGIAWSNKNEADKAIQDLDKAVSLGLETVEVYFLRAVCWVLKKNYRMEILDYENAIRLKPENPGWLYSALAWTLATCPDDRVRDGKRAIQMAKKACTLPGCERGYDLDALAAAYAEVGQFDKAVRYQTEALQTCGSHNRREFQKRLNLYQQRKPYRGKA